VILLAGVGTISYTSQGIIWLCEHDNLEEHKKWIVQAALCQGTTALQKTNDSLRPCFSIERKMAALEKQIALLQQQASQNEERALIGSRLTLLPRDDGFGAQFHGIIAALAYTRRQGLVYVHMPWQRITHGPAEIPQMEWASRLQSFAGVSLPELQHSMDLGSVPAIGVVHSLVESDLDWYYNQEVLQMFRSRYAMSAPDFKRNSAAFLQSEGKTRVAVHIRRGDVNDDSDQTFR